MNNNLYVVWSGGCDSTYLLYDRLKYASDAYPLTVRNTGNKLINISLSGGAFSGVTNNSYSVGVGNMSYSETTSSFTNLTASAQQIYQLGILQTKNIYFKGYLPYGVMAQDYQANINITSD